MSKFPFRWFRIIGILLFILIASQIEWMAAWRLLKDIQLNYFLGYIVIVLVLVLLKVVRLRWFLSYIGHRLTLKAVYQSVIEPGFYGMVTPARLGEFSKVSYLIRFGLTRKQAWGVVLMERLVDFLVLLFASTVGGLYFFVWRERQVEWSVTLFLALFFALYYGLSKIGIVFNTFQKSSKRFALAFSRYSDNFENLNKYGVLAANIFLPISLLILALSFLALWFLGSGLQISSNGAYLGLAYTSSSLVSLLPVSVAGLGTRESIYIVLLEKEGVSTSAAVTISLLDGLVLPILIQAILVLPFLRRSRDG